MYYKRSRINVLFCNLLLSSIFLFSSFFSISFAQQEDNLNGSQPSIIILSISNMTATASTTGLTSITGTVINNSTENVDDIQVDVTLYDMDNSTIRETSRFVTSPFTVYEPGSMESFSFLMSVEDFDYYTARAYAERVL